MSVLVLGATGTIGLQQAMFIIPATAIALALVLYAGSRTIETDMRRLG